MPGASTAARSGVGVGNGSDGAGIEGTRLTPSLLRMGVLRLLLSCPTWHPAEGTVFVKIGRNQEKIQAIEKLLSSDLHPAIPFRKEEKGTVFVGGVKKVSSIRYAIANESVMEWWRANERVVERWKEKSDVEKQNKNVEWKKNDVEWKKNERVEPRTKNVEQRKTNPIPKDLVLSCVSSKQPTTTSVA